MKLLFTRFGRCSSFGGPADKGVSINEGLALFNPSDIRHPRWAHLFGPDAGRVNGLAGNLNPAAHYCAMRWDYSKTPRERIREAIVRVVWQDSSPIWCSPADWGPSDTTGRIIDLSPAAMASLGCRTDSLVEVEVYL